MKKVAHHAERAGLFVEGRLGPHVSRLGNALIANEVADLVGETISMPAKSAAQARLRSQ